MRNKKAKNKCIFCLSEKDPFSREEHIIPESLGSAEIVPKGFVCDECNHYFGSKVENHALSLSPLSIARIFMSIKSKKKRHARYKGVRFAKDDQGIEFEAEGSDKASIVVHVNEEEYNDLEARRINSFYVSLGKGMPSLVRLLIKMGLEFVATSKRSKKLDVYDPAFDEARRATRNPKRSSVWKIAQTFLPLGACWESGTDDKGPYVRKTEYIYGVYRTRDQVVFCFQYWVLIFIVPLTTGGDFEAEIDRLNRKNASVAPLDVISVKLT
jgi:hypothetical protein